MFPETFRRSAVEIVFFDSDSANFFLKQIFFHLSAIKMKIKKPTNNQNPGPFIQIQNTRPSENCRVGKRNISGEKDDV
jgi:hypothetical protein